MRFIAPLDPSERAAFIAAARALVGTPYGHRGRSAAKLDCIGLLVLPMQSIGRLCNDRRVYGRSPEADNLRDALIEHFGPPIPVPPGARAVDVALPGDVLNMTFWQRPQHVALVADYHLGGLSLIHADSSSGDGSGEVTEIRYADPWDKYTAEIFRP